jgi:branched-chain amino acid transport system ATP-binding protein
MTDEPTARPAGTAADPAGPRLSCRRLSGGRGSTVVFRDLDLDVQPGTVLALLGPNGAGKSTLLLTLAGLLPAHGGDVAVDGVSLRNGNPVAANRAGVVLVPDNRSLFPSLTVEENLHVARRGGSAVRELLDVFPALEQRWRLAAGALSGGEQQMLAMARGLAVDPSLLFLDELSMGLAPLIVAELYEIVADIARGGVSILVVEQFARTVLGVADYAAIMLHGRVTAVGQPEDIAPELEAAYLGH